MISILDKDNSKILDLLNDLKSNKNCSCFGLNFNEISFILKFIEKQKIVVIDSTVEAYKYESQLNSLGLRTFVLNNRIENYAYNPFGNDENLKNFLLACFKLINKEIDVLILNSKALTQRFLNASNFENLLIHLNLADNYKLKNIIQKLILSGYRNVDEINDKGEFFVKGDLLSVYPINSNLPYRISFFDEEIERISSFSLETYEIIQDEKSITICPSDFCCDENVKSGVLDAIEKAIKTSKNVEQQNKLVSLKNEILIKENLKSNFFFPFIENFNSSILDYLTDGIVIFIEPKVIVDSINNEYVNFISSSNSLIYDGVLLEEHKKCLIEKNKVFETQNTCLAFLNLNTSNKIFTSNAVHSFLGSFVKNYNGNFNFLLEDIISFYGRKYTIILSCENNEKAIKMKEFLQNNSLHSEIVINYNQIKKSEINIIVNTTQFGTIFNEDKIFVLGNYNIYGAKKVVLDNKIKKVFFTPEINDYCVHETFGICKCKAIEKVSFNGVEKDYIVLEFYGGDTLYLPSEKTNLITKFVGESENPKLNKLGTTDFIKEKIKVKSKIKDLAFDLLTLYAKRDKAKGFKFASDDDVQLAFENAFPFALTSDQEKAIADIKNDMQNNKTMDRLVCGDVGYGKTEVALRAVFKAVLSGKQVAILAPTTILSEQHYKTCIARMSSFSVKIEVLNRFKTNKEAKAILEKLKNGEIDVICGTHRLLSKDVEFKDLGLLVLDEEQRFGVEDKEKIKNLKNDIDVLTLSATPIPRTLNMSLIGVRDISIIDTPPKSRLPIQTIVAEYSTGMVKEAINRELNRNGQVLIVYNKVESINTFAQSIKNLFPDIPLAVAHGQMDKRQLEKIINNVYEEEVKILISTVLIENGIDLPKANTIIIVNSDKLGLSQLYQLRGRVGRSNEQAYAYFTYASSLNLSEEGYKRLASMSEFSGLGSGFKIAMRDLEIRGAGSILGVEQSGHIEKVGYDMYARLLKEAVEELKGKELKKQNDCKMEVTLSSFIPQTYIENESNRLKIYEEISQIKTNEDKLKLENVLREKYGNIPNELKSLILVAQLKNLLVELNAKRFFCNGDKTFIEFYEKDDVLNEKIQKLLTSYSRQASLKFRTLPTIEFNFNAPVIEKLKNLINILINL
ncbi:MAG: transcription-repair coupling factor [Christensenellales bacterium]